MLIGNYFKKINPKYKKHFFSRLSFNSRNCKKNDIFFAVKGTKYDGQKFINNAIDNGAKTIVSNKKYEGMHRGILYIYKKNVSKILAETSFKINKIKLKNLIAVTGTNGKSSVAEFYFQILHLNKKKVASIGTLGIKTKDKNIKVSNTTLDPINLSQQLLKLKKKNINHIILEASSHGLKQNRLDGLKFDIGIFTNLSRDHLDYHKNFKDYLNSKLYLFKKLLKKKSNIITDEEIPQFRNLKRISSVKKINLNMISSKKKGLSLISHKYLDDSQIIKIKYKNKFYNFKLNLIGKIQVKNILMAVLAAEKSGIIFKKIINTLEKIKPTHGRFEKIGKIKNKSIVILDYAHTPAALKTCLHDIRGQFKDRKISLVFGCGGQRDKHKRPQMGKIANSFCDKIYLTDDNPRNENPKKIRQQIKKEIEKSKFIEIPNRAKAIKKAIENLKTGEVLVVAGKGHENTQDYGKFKKFFSDKINILKNIKLKNSNLSNNFKMNILREESKQTQFSLKIKTKNATINSNEIKKNDIFFAIKGKKNDGSSFIKDAFSKKASLVITNKIKKSQSKNKQIKVKNTLEFLTKISSIIRKNCQSKIIAVTGSCGKTSVKELLGKSLKQYGPTFYSPRSFNNQYGVPISLFNLERGHKHGVFEVGMDKKGEIDKLSKIINPDIAIITNISYAHIKNFKNIREIALAKAEIIRNVKVGGTVVLNADDLFYNLHKKIAQKHKIKISSFSLKKNKADVSLCGVKKIKKYFKISIKINMLKKDFIVSSVFDNNIKNILAVLAAISVFRNAKNLNKNTFFNLNLPDGRGDISKIKIGKKNISLVDESYNSNPLSLRSAIKNFDEMDVSNRKKHLILGDMLELGNHSKKLHSGLGSVLNATTINSVNVIGKYVKNVFKEIHSNKKGLILKNNSQIISLIKNNLNNNDYLMIKGSNSTGLNELTNNLKMKKNNAL